MNEETINTNSFKEVWQRGCWDIDENYNEVEGLDLKTFE